MTWAEFKTAVDAVLRDKGRSDDVDINWIDVAYPDLIKVEIDADNAGLEVS